MPSRLQTPFGHGAPPYPGHEANLRHIITTNFPTWNHILRFIDRDPEIMNGFVNMYPRVIMHKDVIELRQAIMKKAGLSGHTCLVFTARESADACVDYATSLKRGDQQLSPDVLSIRVFDIHQRFWAVFFPIEKTPNVMMFWINPGVGASTRQAESALKHIDQIREVTDEDQPQPVFEERCVYGKLRRRIVDLLNRAPLDPTRRKPATSDVYLYPTGMAVIFRLHQYLTQAFSQRSVVYGFPFHATYLLYEGFGQGFEFFGLGDDSDLAKLNEYLEEGNKIQALLCEFPSNPLAVTPDVTRLRQLADRFHFFLILDDTIGSFANVDLTSVADALATSLTKSFSGYADVMGGSLTLNPTMPRYDELKAIVDKNYRNDLYLADAEVLLSNSDDYLHRTSILNRNSLALATYFNDLVADPSSPVKRVYYPPVLPSHALYKPFMRPSTPDFEPGYGCLMSIEFKDVLSTIAFHDALDVFKAPHLGAHCTLALPYVKALFAKQLDWAAKYDLRETMIRIAPGLEDTEELLKTFKVAVEAAEKAKENLNGSLELNTIGTVS